MLSLCAIVLVGLDLLSGNRSLVGVAIGLKYVFIDEFLPVFLPICFLACCRWLLELLCLCVIGESIVVVLLSATGATSWSTWPLWGGQRSRYSFFYSTRLY